MLGVDRKRSPIELEITKFIDILEKDT